MVKIVKKSKFIRGLALAEAVITIGILATGAMAMGSITNDAMRFMALSKNYLIAQNLMTEEEEAIKNIRDSNWMLNPDNSVYWLCMKPATKCTGSSTVTTPANYVLKQDTFKKWYLEQVPAGTADLDLEGNMGRGSTGKNNYGLVLTNGRYVSSVSGQILYYRSAKFLTKDDLKAEILLRIQWYEGAKVRSIEKNLILHNYR